MEDQQESVHVQTQLLHYWANTPEEEYYNKQGIKSTESYYTSPRGLSPQRSFLLRWVLLVLLVLLWTLKAMEDHKVPRVMCPMLILLLKIVCLSSIQSNKRLNSMGGAICLLIHFADPKGSDGAVLVAPMCRVSDKQKPKWLLSLALKFLAKFFPTLAIFPAEELDKKSIKVEAKRVIGTLNPLKYRRNPKTRHCKSATELLRVTDYLIKDCNVSIPFIVLHGSVDVVTDPNASKALIYDGMMHSLLFGDTDENIEIIRNDILSWLNGRCKE
ncbi:hypothetical protein ACOSQ2_012426 [Xanthoceras sorbifolium]